MNSKGFSKIAALTLAVLPAPAVASDMSGLIAIMTLMYVVAPLTIVHLMATLVLALKRFYRPIEPALWHSLIALIAPALGMAVVGADMGATKHAQSRDQLLAILTVAMALAWLPLIIHFFQRKAEVQSSSD